jgi:hypothetical protein
MPAHALFADAETGNTWARCERDAWIADHIERVFGTDLRYTRVALLEERRANFAASTAFSGDESTEDALRAGYAGLTDLVWGRLPTFDEAIDSIRDNRHFI